MAATLRLCVLVEVTARHRHLWHHTTLPQVVEPLLAYLQAAIGVELALVLFGAHPPHSLAAAESPLGWCRGVGHFRRQLLDGGSLECAGGGGQPVALAEALLEAAALFTLPGGGSTCQQHCLVCLASEPAVQPVAWPFFQDCSMAKLPGLATSTELCHALRRQGIQLGVAGGNLFASSRIFWHLANILSDRPLSLAESRVPHLRQHQEATLQRLMRTAVTLPGGGGMAVLPSWPEALEVLQKGGAKLLPPTAALLGSSRSSGGEGSMPAPAASQAMPAAAAAPSSCGPGTAASAGGEPSPAIQLPNWTPPAAAQGTPPLDGAAGASPGSFWEVLNAEILLSPDGLAPNPGAGGGMPAPAAAMLPPAQAPPQQLAPPPQQLPAVQGLPTPPGPPLQGLQRWPTPDEAALASAASLGSAGGGSKYALVHTAQLLVDPKLTKGAPRMLGLAEVLAMPHDAPAMHAMRWPAELRLVKTMSVANAAAFLAGRPNWPTRIKIQQYASQEAQAFLTRMLDGGVVGVVGLHNGAVGMLRPGRHPATQQLLLQMMIVPNAMPSGG